MRPTLLFIILAIGFPDASFAQLAAPLPPLASDLVQGDAGEGETPVDLETALQRTLSSNPDLVSLRQNLCVSSAAVAVARQFPMSLNPTLSVDVRPWTFEHDTGQGSQRLDTQVSVSWMQPIEFGHRIAHRTAIAQAAYTQSQWNILQAELQTLVETYRQHQTAVYRREKLRVARQLAQFNAELLTTVQRQSNAGQVGPSELVLAEVENQSMVQRLQTAQQDYVESLAALRRQIGLPHLADSLLPAGDLKTPEGFARGGEEDLVRIALESHPEINAARAQASGSRAAVCLARAERIPIPSAGPVYEHDETGTTYYGMVLSTPVPVLNTGRTLVCQREMEHNRDLVALEQLRLRTMTRVKTCVVRWNQSTELVDRVVTSTNAIQSQTERMERLFTAGQTDLLKLLQVRQRLIEAENARLDMVWQATQAYADLLAALGATPLLGAVQAVH